MTKPKRNATAAGESILQPLPIWQLPANATVREKYVDAYSTVRAIASGEIDPLLGGAMIAKINIAILDKAYQTYSNRWILRDRWTFDSDPIYHRTLALWVWLVSNIHIYSMTRDQRHEMNLERRQRLRNTHDAIVSAFRKSIALRDRSRY